MTMRIPLLACCLLLAALAATVNAKKTSPFYRIDSKAITGIKEVKVNPNFELPPSSRRKLEHSGQRRNRNNNHRRSLVERELQRQLEPTAVRSSDYDTTDRRPPRIQPHRKLSALHNAGGTRSAGTSYASVYNHHVKEEEKKYEDVSTNEGDYNSYEDNDQDKGKYGEHATGDDDEYYYGSRPSSGSGGDDDDGGGKGRGGGGKGYSYGSSSSSSYSSRSSKSSKSTKSEKSEKSSKSGKSSRGDKPTTKP
ncbi:MAG: hypothetical protein SGARI_007151, partial [Bacillariaceae sp.]